MSELKSGEVGMAETRGFLVTLVTTSLLIFNMGFDIAAYGELFFETYLKVWVAAMVVILGSLVLPAEHRPISGRGYLIMFLPTLYFPASVATTWMVSTPPANTSVGLGLEILAFCFMILTALAYLIAIPYVIYTLARILDPSLVQMPTRRMRIGLISITLLMGMAGLLTGGLHPYWLTCDEFRIAGVDVPDNCTVNLLAEPGQKD